MQPMDIGLYDFIGQYGVQWNKPMAGRHGFCCPPLVVALVAGKSIVVDLTAGLLKSKEMSSVKA